MFPTRDPRWPLMGGIVFQVSALLQIAAIASARDAGSVSVWTWALAGLVLLGYVDFYNVHMSEQARVYGIVSSLISASLYVVIVTLTFVF
jgi:UDP-N-acetylmuramyl pentapeptide phosphotransferase/UDP-N-acetylglucosamine-1-phosphate transferase